MALKDVPQHADVLDVGCGVGAFLDVLRDRREARATGIDLSSEAVAIAQRLGRSASLGDLVNAVEGRIGEFDVVCVFQVLEHVADPRRFLQGCVRLLKPGGRLCVGVPNNDGYLGFQRIEDASLNLPPHHATRWGLRTLRMLERLFPLRLRRLRCEPLARWHVPGTSMRSSTPITSPTSGSVVRSAASEVLRSNALVCADSFAATRFMPRTPGSRRPRTAPKTLDRFADSSR